MPTGQEQRIRKGTKSCTECRRRKIRCIQSFENAQTCRRCEERGSECIAQTHTSGSTGRKGFNLSSKNRIAQLETRVLNLTETIRQMQQKLNFQTTQDEEVVVDQTFTGYTSDENRSVSEQSIAEQPFHLRLLFQNDWLSEDSSSTSQATEGYEATNTSHLSSIARKSLQKLIPSKDDISVYTSSASEWLTLLHSFFPLPSDVKFGEDMIACYEEMHCPDVDTIRLASWLLTVALMVEQLPPKNQTMESWLDKRERQKSLTKAVSATVENKILIHDALTSSVHGLSVFMLCIRLEIGRGNIHKAWVKLRQTIAIAELMGLHNVVQVSQLQMTTEVVDEQQISKVRLWDLICAADKLLGMMLNLSPITSSHRQGTTDSVSINGVVQNDVYLCRLTNIANKVQDLDHFNIFNGPRTEACTLAMELSRELNTLGSQTPAAWWSGGMYDTNNFHPDHIVQFLHYYIAMRIHLPLTLRQCQGGENLLNRLACVDACMSILQRYQILNRRLPPGLFLSEMLDLQAFSAAITLLLISHTSSVCPMDVGVDMGVDRIKIRNEVEQVIKLLHKKSDGPHGYGFAYNGFTTLRSLNDLLQGTENDLNRRKIAFHAPLLGKVQVRRNEHSFQEGTYWPSQILSALGFCNAEMPIPDLNMVTDTSMQPCLHDENEQWDRITRSTEDMFRGLL